MSAALLQKLGKPDNGLITLDFETYWDGEYKLKKCTTEGYVRDPRFEVIGVGVKFAGRPAVWLEEYQFRAWAASMPWHAVGVLCHNAQFDAFILSHHYGIRPGMLYCTMSMGRALHGAVGVSLNALSERYGVGKKGDEVRKTSGMRRKHFSREAWDKFGAYCINDCELTRALFDRMRFPKLEYWVVDSTIRMFTEPVFETDRAILDAALAEERRRKAETLASIQKLLSLPDPESARAALASASQFAEILRRLGVTVPMKPGARGMIPATAKNDPGMQGLLESPNPDVRQAAKARLEITSRIVETRTERLIQIAERGPVPFYLKYCGAHTHRWSGGDKMNPQNFNRGGSLRGAILAPAGHVLCVADLSQIEARMLAWVARQTELLDTFRKNDALGEDGDFYSDEGSRLFRKPLSKKETPKERQVSKGLLLGLGFNMGWPKCAQELLKGMLGTPPVQFTQADATRYQVSAAAFAAQPRGRQTCGEVVRELISNYGVRLSYADLLVHCAVTEYFVNLYRKTYPKVAATWQAMGRVIEVMARPDGAMTVGCLKVIPGGIVKPSGLVLHYPELRRTKDGWFYLGGDSGREMKKIYGGLLTENVVQSLARDVIAEQAMWIRADGHRLGTTTHDDIAAVVPEEQAEQALQGMLARMRVAPAWCADLPLNAEGGFARSYGAAK